MKEELDKLLFATLCELHPDRLSANPKDVQGLIIMEGALNFLEGIYKIQDKNWEPSEEFLKVKYMLEELKKNVKPKPLPGSIINEPANHLGKSALNIQYDFSEFNPEKFEYIVNGKPIENPVIEDMLSHLNKSIKVNRQTMEGYENIVRTFEEMKKFGISYKEAAERLKEYNNNSNLKNQ